MASNIIDKFDTDTDNESFSSESESDESSSEDEEEVVVPLPPRTGGLRTRGGLHGCNARTNVQEQQWQEKIIDPEIPQFSGYPGVSQYIPRNVTMLGCVKLFLTDELIEMIVEETNRYATQFINREDIPSSSRVNDWKSITNEEFLNFLALTLLMGMNGKRSIPDYWSTNPLYYNSTFSLTMSRDRYQLILKFLHFSDNEQIDKEDRLYKVRPICEYLVHRFQAIYTPEKEISIDEQLMLHKGHLNFKQYVPNKRAKFGIKIFSPCDNSGYLWNSEVYAGKNKVLSKNAISLEQLVGKSGAVVLRLMKPLLGRGYRLFIDNWYTSYHLYRNLLDEKTVACGTLRKNRANLPLSFASEKLKRGETRYISHENMTALRYMDKKDVYV